MDIGITLPQTEFGPEPDRLVRFARAVEDNGFAFLLAYDHILGADWAARGHGEPGPYDINTPFHEVFVLFGFLAAHLTRIELTTGVAILSLRQTAVVAKQSAEIDILTGGRFRLGIGTGWNFAEYETLGTNFHDRGKRSEEQIAVLRMLWTQDVVDFHGTYHELNHVGILHRPVQRPIPVWIGGGRDDRRVQERVGRIADGWVAPTPESPETWAAAVSFIRETAEKAGRDPASIGFQRQISLLPGADLDHIRRELDTCRDQAVDKVSIGTMNADLAPEAHIDMVGKLAELVARG